LNPNAKIGVTKLHAASDSKPNVVTSAAGATCVQGATANEPKKKSPKSPLKLKASAITRVNEESKVKN